jgi:TldD protein
MSERPSRRDFLAASSAVVALAAFGKRASAQETVERRLALAENGTTRDVGAAAVQAARDAGASYADIRINVEESQVVSAWQHHTEGSVRRDGRFVYGIRVIANGQWGFAGDVDPTTDGAAQCARRAVAQAIANAAIRRPAAALAPAPIVANGRWATPIELDPFAVSPAEQQELLLRGAQAALRVKWITLAGGAFGFSRTERTFASSDGSWIVQTLWFANPSVLVSASSARDQNLTISRQVRALSAAAKGYEIIRDSRLADEMTAAAESAARDAELLARARPVDVGRYDVVVSAQAMASLVAETLGQSTNWEWANRADVGGDGRSAGERVARGLGRPIASPLVTLTGDRIAPGGLATVRWDDEGVPTESFALIDRGVLVDYQTTRESAGSLASWYHGSGRPLRSHGCAVAAGLTAPRGAMPNLTMRPPPGTNTHLSDLIADVDRGIVVAEPVGSWTDESLQMGALLAPLAYEVRKGKVVGALRDARMVFRTRELWSALDAVGGDAAAANVGVGGATVRAVPGRFRGIGITNNGLAI